MMGDPHEKFQAPMTSAQEIVRIVTVPLLLPSSRGIFFVFDDLRCRDGAGGSS
jgi:hypothetical protein